MFDIKVIASSSAGNCFIVSDGITSLLLDAGVKMKEILVACDFNMDKISGALITHEHKDHARSVEELTGRSIRIYGSAAVAAKFKDVRCVRPFARYAIDTVDFFAVPMEHDTTCYAYCIRSVKTGDTLLYATDTKRMTEYIDGLGQMIIESNYNVELLENSVKPRKLVRRIADCHMSVETLAKYISRMDQGKLQEIYLCHLSDDHSDVEKMVEKVRKVTQAKIFVCNKNGGVTDAAGIGTGKDN